MSNTRVRQGVLSLLLLAFASVSVLWLAKIPLSGDFLAYWSGSVLAARGENAYDAEALYRLQVETGRAYDETIHVWNPPWLLPMLLPLALLPFALARAIWLVGSIALLALSGYWLGRVFWRSDERRARLISAIIPFLLFQSWVALLIGQVNVLVLFGISGALFLFEKHPAASGALLVLATIKPQMSIGALLLFGLWALVERRWSFFGGALATLGLLLLLLTALRPMWPLDYQAVLNTPLLLWRTPTLATVAREQWPTLPVPTIALSLAAVALLALSLWSYVTRRWQAGIASALVITMLFTLFNWSYDQIILLVPVYFLLGETQHRPLLFRQVVFLLGLVSALTFVTRWAAAQDDFVFFWVVPAFALLYAGALWLVARRGGRMTVQAPSR